MADTQDATTATKPEETTTAAPIFGSASTFGASTGFAGFTGVSTTKETDGGDDEHQTEEDECQAEFKPIVQLQEIETATGEEEEICWADFKCKLYRFDNDAGEWKERGVGQIKLLEHKENNKVRVLMRQEKTLKIRANHIAMPGTKLQEHSGSEKAWVWSTPDFADETQKMELFCVRFSSVERAQEFKTNFERAMSQNEKLIAADEAAVGEEDEAAEEKSDAAELIAGVEKVTVEDKEENADEAE